MKKHIVRALLLLVSCTCFVHAVKLETEQLRQLRKNLLNAIIKKDNINTVEKLLGKIDINNVVEEKTGYTPYHRAILQLEQSDVIPYLELFYEKGLDINKKDAQGHTPLHMAVRAKLPNAVQFFLDKRAIVDTKRNDGETPLSSAKKRGNKEIIDMLEKELKTEQLLNNILNAIIKKDNIDTVEKLLEKIDINDVVEKKTGFNPYHRAILHLESDAVPYLELFYKKGLDINKKDAQGHTPLHMAVRAKLPNAVQFFLKKGAIVDTKRDDGATPLSSAKKYGNKEIIDMLEKELKTENITEKQNLKIKNAELIDSKKEKDEREKIKKLLKKNPGEYAVNSMIFKFFPDKNQKNFESYTNKKELYTITTYTDKNDDVHYTIEYYNPFGNNVLGKLYTIDKKEYDEKANAINKAWSNDGKKFCFIRISMEDQQNIDAAYIQRNISYVKNKDTYKETINDSQRINNPLFSNFPMVTTIESSEFNEIEKEYNQQQKLLKQLHKEWLKQQPPHEEFLSNKQIPYDFKFEYNN